MTLCIDIGNSRTKAGIFKNDELGDVFIFENKDARKLLSSIPLENFKQCIISSTIQVDHILIDGLGTIPQIITLDENTPLPFKNRYQTPATLGKDRLALVAAAMALHPGRHVLVIGCGTCITFNFKNANEEFQGGSIHPGLKMRLQAMHTFTGKLPLIPLKKPEKWLADSTENALLSGTVFGGAAEIDGMIDEYAKNYEDLTVLITGGDAEMLVSLVKNKIFAVPHLTLVGLNQILKSNV